MVELPPEHSGEREPGLPYGRPMARACPSPDARRESYKLREGGQRCGGPPALLGGGSPSARPRGDWLAVCPRPR